MVLSRAHVQVQTRLQMVLDNFLASKLDGIQRTYNTLTERLGDPDVLNDASLLQSVSQVRTHRSHVVLVFCYFPHCSGCSRQDRAKVEGVAFAYQEYKELLLSYEEAKEMAQDDDGDIREMARAELRMVEGKLDALEESMHIMLLPKDPNDEKNVMVEIRAGTGGNEAALFAADLMGIYRR
jgi:peptide chain release factor 1